MSVFELGAELVEGLPRTGATDPIEYYRRPLLGRVYRERINRGLRLLPRRRVGRALEVGYGAGAVLLALAPGVQELHGVDLDADPQATAQSLRARGVEAKLEKSSVYQLPFPDGFFELVVSFSVFEHLAEYPRALAEVARVLRPGGLFLLGMPAVNRVMELGFRAIGFKGIEDHHVTTPQMVRAELARAGLRELSASHLDLPLRRPLGLRVYFNWLSERSLG